MTNNQLKDEHTVLSELLGSLQMSGEAIDAYFDQVRDGEMLNPILASGKLSSMGNKEALPHEFFPGFGIRKLILDALHGRLSLSGKTFIEAITNDIVINKWNDWRNDVIMEDFKMLFEHVQIVEFDKWSDVKDASALWDNLRRDVIKPLKKNDFDFIFHLGDTTKKLAFEVDEFLDIVSDFSVYGRVTLILDKQNIDHLWAMFFDRNAYSNILIPPGLHEKCRTVFDLINMEYLLIDSFPATFLFSRQQQFEIKARNSFSISKMDRKYLDAGYILGLVLKMDILHSMVLGLAVSGVYAENELKQDRKNLLGYIENWMREKESIEPEERQLSVA